MKTKTTNIIQRLSLFLFVLVLTMPAWAQGNNGTEVVSIGSKAEWKAFCQRVNDNGEPFLNAKLTQDVDLGGEIVMLGSVSYPYSGTFDGNGHTLKFNWNAGKDNQIAPFYYVENATIKNLRTQGKITSKGYSLSGMVRVALGTTTITGCISDVDITGGNGGWNDSKAAGMVQAVADGASVHITDCLVKGRITDNADESYKAMAGFVFSNSGTYTLTRCLYVGKNNATSDTTGKTFGETGGISATFTDCYYRNTCGKAQGDKITEAQLRNGYVAYKLQKGRESQVWGQTLGTDNEPQLTADATKRVYEVKFVYNGEVKATRYANSGKTVELPTAEELLGTGYNPKMTYTLNFGNFTATTPVTEDKSVDVTVTGTFPIATAADWKEFCALVNGGQTTLNAKMTADVNLGSDITMAGTANKPYAGTFDGQNHVLTVNWDAGSVNNIAPFGRVNGATIKNLRTEGSIRSDGYYLSGLIDEAYGGSNTVANCVSAVNITSSYTSDRCGAGGLISYIFPSARVTINDCLVKGSIDATTEKGQKGMGGFVYSQNGTCTLTRCLYAGTNNADNSNNNCYTFAPTNTSGATTTLNNCHYLNPCGKLQGEQATKEQLKNGYVAHKLQGTREETVWGQVLGTDTVPQPTADATKRVYQVKFNYNGNTASRYATSGSAIFGGLPTAQELLGAGYNPKLTYALNFGDFTATTPVTADKSVDVTVTVSGTFDIASKDDWKVFCDIVNNGVTRVDAKLMNDVDLGGEIVMAGTSAPDYSYFYYYTGTFDGQGHTLSFNWNAGEDDQIAPFKLVKGATIKNLRTEGAIRSDGYYLGGLIDEAYGENTITGCVSNVNLTSTTVSRWCGTGGLISYISTNGRVTINDCLVTGDINATTDEGKKGMGGFVYANNGTCTMNNCLYAGTNNGNNNAGRTSTFTTNTSPSATLTLNNCHYLNPCGKLQGEPVTKEQLKNGYVAHLLQGTREETVWGQVLGTDTIPQPTAEAAKQVYEVKFTLNNEPKVMRYANRGGHVSLPTVQELLGADYAPNITYALSFEGGFSASSTVTGNTTVVANVVFKDISIATKEDWKKFGELIRSGEGNLNAKLTRDIDLGGDILKIGSESTGYSGTFDGQGHTITIDWNGNGGGYIALFPFVTNATIKNLRVTGQMTSDSEPLGVFAFEASGTTTFSGCVSDVKITNGDKNDTYCAAGMVRAAYSKGKITFKDCIVAGDLNGTTDNSRQGMGGFVCGQADDATCTFNNCLYTGTNNAKGGYTFAPNPTLNNCYYLNPCGTAQGDKITEAQQKSGYVAHKLQGDRTDNVWGQTLGTDLEPQLTTEKAKHVYKVDFKYMDKVKATRYANSGGRVKLPTAKELLGADYDAQKSYTLTFENGFSETTAINGDITVSVTVNVVTGIDGVTDDNSTVRGAVYNLQGVRVAESSDAETLRRLPAGVYIVKGKKFVVR